MHEETKIFVHETAKEWFDSLWDHGTRAKLEQLSSEQFIDLRQNALKKGAQYANPHGLREDLQVFYGVADK